MEKKELDALPESDNEFWENAEKIKKEIKHTQCDHSFVYVAANTAECEICHAGYTLGLGWHIKDKKLYYEEQLVI